MLPETQMEEVNQMQLIKQENLRTVPEEGKRISYLGKEFIVYRNVPWPFDDSMPLVENYTINQGDSVLDVCTGSGVIAVFSACKGAGKVVAIDINPDAIRATEANVRLHGFSGTIEARLSDMFDAIHDDEQFDVITGNLPFRNKTARDYVEASQWDTDLNAHRRLFAGVNMHLKPNGRVYLSQANFGAVGDMKQLADAAGFSVRQIGQKTMSGNDPRIYYAFELTRI